MTRGKFFLIFKDKFVASTEFNGDMYPEGYGDTAFTMLDEAKDEESFNKMVLDFNSKAHNYKDDVMFWEGTFEEIKKQSDMTKKYYDFWFSDWIFLKNLSGKTINFIVNNENDDGKLAYSLKNQEKVRFNFGRISKYSTKLFDNKNIYEHGKDK